VSEKDVKEWHNDIQALDLAGFSKNQRQHEKFIMSHKRAAAEARGEDPDMVKEPTRTTMRRSVQKIAPEKVDEPGVQNPRRLIVSTKIMKNADSQANGEMENYIALAAVAISSTAPPGGEPTAPELITNTDMTTIALGDRGAPVYLARGSRNLLATHHLRPCTTKKKTVTRYAGYLPTLAANGDLVCSLVIIKDTDFPKAALYHVSVAIA
jgi:hypothetical protein